MLGNIAQPYQPTRRSGKQSQITVIIRQGGVDFPFLPQGCHGSVQHPTQGLHTLVHTAEVLPCANTGSDHLIGSHPVAGKILQVGHHGVLQLLQGGAWLHQYGNAGNLGIKAVQGHSLQDLILGGKVFIHGALADSGFVRDLLHLHGGGVYPLGNQAQGGFVQGGFAFFADIWCHCGVPSPFSVSGLPGSF